MILGPDISFWQDKNETPQKVDFNKMKSAGAKFVIIRAGQNVWEDPDFQDYWRDAELAGLPRGSYWFYDSRIDPILQAQKWLDVLPPDQGELPMFLDIEANLGGGYWSPDDWKTMLEYLKLHTNHELGVYTAYYVWRDNTTSAQRPYFSQYPLWVANYGVAAPAIPPGWDDWLFWQFTTVGDGELYGVESKGIDLNYFNGDKNLFNERFSLGEVVEPDPPPIGGNMTKELFTNGATLEEWQEFGHTVHVLTIPAGTIEIAGFHYTPGQGGKAEDFVNNEYKIFFNFPPYDFGTFVVNEGLKISGKSYHDYVDYDPWLEWLNNAPRITHVKAQWKNVLTGAQGFRYVYENGEITPTANAEWNKRYAQRVVASDAAGNTIVFSSAGEPDGLNLYEVADIFSRWVSAGHGEYPIRYALQGDSGHSVQVAYYKDGQLETFVGPQDGNRNMPVCWGFLKLRTPLISLGVPEPPNPDPEPEPGLPDLNISIVAGDDVSYAKQSVDVILKALK